MAKKHLVIVESPAKAKTIGKYLGKDYEVKASMGHLRDLPKSKLGVDIEHDFEPVYQPIRGKEELISELKKAAKSSDTVYLATDPDREGEAISWHLKALLNLDDEKAKRVTFNEITKKVVSESIKEPRAIDQDLVDAQQARRVLDRIVGYQLSPLLWKKVRRGLSAGRVQSVAVRMVDDREKEIQAFEAQEYWTLDADLTDEATHKTFEAHYYGKDGKKVEPASGEQVDGIIADIGDKSFTVTNIKRTDKQRSPSLPFTTSTLQQEASRKLNMTPRRTMAIAQQLYEGVDITGEGTVGLITYMRTDSQNLSSQAIAAAREEIIKMFGEEYSSARKYKTKSKGAQEAHEAIRPSYLNRQQIEGSPEEKRLYDLIWKRTVASQMSPARIEKTVVSIAAGESPYKFTATGEVILFDGFLRLYSETIEDETEEGQENTLPELKAGDGLSYQDISATERFTQPPFRYSEASLVRRLEELGIGRPSTYAPTISTIINRGYVIKQNKQGTKRSYRLIRLEKGKISSKELSETTGREKAKLTPTDIGMIVNDYLDKHFEEILDYNFTANVEKEFDEIAEGGKEWTNMIREFYTAFHPTVEKALEELPDRSGRERILGTDPKSGKQVSARIGRYGPIVQIGSADDEEKPRYASMKKDQLIATITLDEALALFELPRTLGELDGKEQGSCHIDPERPDGIAGKVCVAGKDGNKNLWNQHT